MTSWHFPPSGPAVQEPPKGEPGTFETWLRAERPARSGAAMSVLEESRPFAQQLSNVYFTILSLFCFKLFVKISLAILSHFYIVKGNRKEAARIAAEFYGVTQGQGMFMVMLSCFTWHLTTATATAHENIACFLYGLLPSEYAPIVPLEKHL